MGPNKMSGLDLLVVVVVFYYIAEVLLVSKLWLFGKKYHTAHSCLTYFFHDIFNVKD